MTGLDLFKERFAKFTSNYVLIGGAAGSEAVQHEAVGGCTSEHDCSGTSVVYAFAADRFARTT